MNILSIIKSITTSARRTLDLELAEPLDIPGIKNFYQVTPWLYRGGQPTHVGFEELQKLGIKTVISFRWGRRINAAEEKAVTSLGMVFESLPLNYWNLPDQATIDRFLSLLDNAGNQPIYVHCLHGADRTGVLLAIFRISRMDWSVDHAYAEMKYCGFHRFRLRHFKWVLFNYARRSVKPPQGNNPGRISVNP